MTKGTIFSDEDFFCTVQIEQQQVFVPKDKANVYEAEQVCKNTREKSTFTKTTLLTLLTNSMKLNVQKSINTC